MDLLAAVGHNTIGRVRVVPHGQPLPARTDDPDISTLLQQSNEFLARWFLNEHLLKSGGVSGGYIKGLSKSPAADGVADRRFAMRDRDWIIKVDDADHPAMSFNEYWSMEVAREAGLDAAETRLSSDMRSIAVKRFDVAEDGTQLGFEDFCALLATPAREKMGGTVEKMVKSLPLFIPAQFVHQDMERFFGWYLCANTLRNGDAHLKNFGVLYATPDLPRLSPVYDMVTMTLWAPAAPSGDAHDTLALTFGGTKRWLTDAQLTALGERCGLNKRERDAVIDRLSKALVSVSGKLVASVERHPEFAQAAARMLQLWSHGARALSADISDALRRQSDLATAKVPVEEEEQSSRRAPAP
jgi:serine/threonine-protein kinase HipA